MTQPLGDMGPTSPRRNASSVLFPLPLFLSSYIPLTIIGLRQSGTKTAPIRVVDFSERSSFEIPRDQWNSSRLSSASFSKAYLSEYAYESHANINL